MIVIYKNKKIEFFDYEEFEEFLKEKNFDYKKNEIIEFFTKNKINEIKYSELPFKKKRIKKENKKIKEKENNKSKFEIFLEKSNCPKEKIKRYFEKLKQEYSAFKNSPPQKYLKKTLYYVYLPDYEYYALIIQNEFNYFKNYNYKILDKKNGYYFDLYYIKLSLLKKYFNNRKILNINGLCHFEGFDKAIFSKIPDKPVIEIDYMEKIR